MTKQLNPKYLLPTIAALDTKSPTLQRIKLEDRYVSTLEVLRADITDAHQYVQNFEALKEGEVAFRTSQTMMTFDHIHTITPVHTAKHFAGRKLEAFEQDPSRLVWSYECMNIQQLESAIEDIVARGMTIACKRRITDTSIIYYVLNCEQAELHNVVEAYHTKALEAECAKHQAKLDEAKFQFEMFKSHYKARCKEIVDLKTLETSPVLQ
ncbi:hypothetical protein [Enterobacter mori]